MRPGHLLLLGAAALLVVLGLALGPVTIAPGEIAAVAAGSGDPVHAASIGQIRAPRILLGVAVGTALALAGAALQGLLRNPLADPGLIGVTGGASIGAVSVIVLGEVLFGGGTPGGGTGGDAGGDDVGGGGGAGVAVNAIAGAFIGVMVYISDDTQLRDLTFWSLGALGAANWTLVLVASGISLASALALLSMHRALDLFQVGERAAFHAGIDTERVKLKTGLLTALAVGGATAAAGPIGFIGLVAPHIARLLLGAHHRIMMPAAALTGIALVLSADLAVRLAVPPAEPPIGIATSLLGGPVFLWLLLTRVRRHA